MMYKYWAIVMKDYPVMQHSSNLLTAHSLPEERTELRAFLDTAEAITLEVWQVLSSLEKARAKNLSDMLLDCSNGNYLPAMKAAVQFLCRTDGLLKCLIEVSDTATIEGRSGEYEKGFGYAPLI
jgi:hypothetical protein